MNLVTNEKLELVIIPVADLEKRIHRLIQEHFPNSRENTKEPEDEIFSLKGTAKFLELAPSTIYNYVSNGDIPYSKRGKKLYFSKKDLLTWIKSSRVKCNSEIEVEAQEYLKKGVNND